MNAFCCALCLFVILLSACGVETNTVSQFDDISLKMGVTLRHSTHTSQVCTACHPANIAIGKIPFLNSTTTGLGKDIGHDVCKACHVAEQRGPVFCKDCHIIATP